VLADILEEVLDIGADGRIRVLPGSRTVGLRAALGAEVTVFQIQGYRGFMLLPLKDGTSGAGPYGGGRYLLKSIEGADLGIVHEKLILDFNFSYQPPYRHSDA
jgi:uncharacterized protein